MTTSTTATALIAASPAAALTSTGATPVAGARVALRGDLLDFTGDVPLQSPSDDAIGSAVRFRPDHWLLIEKGRITGAQAQDPGAGWTRVDHRGHLVLPGFIDTHVHSAQIDVMGAWGTQLLDWLDTHTFPAEQRMADPAHARRISELFVASLLSRGTTTACVFPTVHPVSVDALFEAALARGMRLVAGKVLMDRHAPPALCDDPSDAQIAARACVDQIARWHGHGRLAYAVTPRFAPTSSAAQLAMAGELLRSTPGLYMQTHVAENLDEVRWVRELFPQARSYLDVYERHGLLNERAILAHGIWLDDEDRARLAATGGALAFCPSSNLFLGSGTFDWPAAMGAGVPVGLATDVGGGTSLDMRRAMLDAYQVQASAGRRVTAFALLHAATLGAAKALRLSHEIGSLQAGAVADLCVWRWASTPLAWRRQQAARGLHDRLFAWMTLAGEGDLLETRVAGVVQDFLDIGDFSAQGPSASG
ncbi:MAG: guanine deaminase [Rubrivivax sp.]